MTISVVVHPAARREALRAQFWYDEIAPDLGGGFARRLLDALETIGGNPHLYADIGKGLHRVFVQRFPYQVFYRIAPDRVNVLAVCHSHADRRNVMKQAFRREKE